MMRAQMGFSLIEVLVALLILSMAIFGFLAVQMKATYDTNAAVIKTHAVSAMSTQAEILQDMPMQVRTAHTRLFHQLNQGVGDDMMTHYKKSLLALDTPCHIRSCNQSAFLMHQTKQSAQLAAEQGIRLNIVPCDSQYCIIAAWGNTYAGVSHDGCINANGDINQGADCMMMVIDR